MFLLNNDCRLSKNIKWVYISTECDLTGAPCIKKHIDVKNENKDNVFVFNGWMFSSSPSIKPFDHPVYDIWLTGCR